MEIQQIRNATLRLTITGKTLLTDPCLAPKGSMESWGNVAPNPIVELPLKPEDIYQGIEGVVVSHVHQDHFDAVAQDLLPKDIPILCQPADENRIGDMGFRSVTAVRREIDWLGITVTRTSGTHGTGKWAERLGSVSGFVFKAEKEPTLYWAGDTVWCDEIRQVLKDVAPDIVLTHSSGAKLDDGDPIVMDAPQTIAVCKAAPKAVVVATHMEAFDHGTVTRADLRSLAEKEGIEPDRLLIPADGETIRF